jgi:hypothetical protein
MIDFSNPWMALLAGFLGLLVLPALATLLFLAGCALADVAAPRLPRAVLAAVLALVLCVPVGCALVVWFGGLDGDPTVWFGPMRSLGFALALLSAWALSALLYKVVLAAPLKKGLIIAGVELSLGALFSALLAGVVLVILAVVQIMARPAPPPKAQHAPLPLAHLASILPS